MDTCATCRQLVSGLASALPAIEGDPPTPTDALAPGARIGRYVLGAPLGAGGMGAVYAARDPELDRDVAIKVLRPGVAGDDAPGRLLREAQVMARLSHRNVVAVHDVGTDDGRVFIALELIEGETLTTWLARPRSWREILDVFVDAGRGLAAAHRVAIVHRDFKPSNVLIARDGRVCVSDFGLASASDLDARPGGPTPAGDALRLTRTDALVGTPAYMAPEQLAGGRASPSSDQFAFAVALWEALTGAHPFGLRSLDELAAATRAGRVVAPPPGRKVPPKILRAVRRALAPSPDDRFASMDVLLGELARPREARRSVAAVALAVVGAGAIVGAILYAGGARPEPPCRGAERKLAGVWDATRKAQVHGAFLASGQPYAEASWLTVERLLDKFATDFGAMHRDACEATEVRHDQSEALLDRRMACLDERLLGAGALTSLFATGEPEVVRRAVNAVADLPLVADCGDPARLTSEEVEPAAPSDRRTAASIRARLADAWARYTTGRYADGLTAARPLVDEARALGFRPLEARVLYQVGRLEEASEKYAAAEATLQAATLAAEAGRADELAARSWSALAYLVGFRLRRHDDGEVLLQRAAAAVERVGARPVVRLAYLDALASLRLAEGKYEASLAAREEALTIARAELGADDPTVGKLTALAGQQLQELGRTDQAIARLNEAQGLLERSLGAAHPAVGVVLGSLGTTLSQRGRHAEAADALERAAAIAGRAQGEDSVAYATKIGMLASEYRILGRTDEARDAFQRAIAITERKLGPEHPDVAMHLANYSILLRAEGKLAETIATRLRVLAIKEKALKPGHASLGHAHLNLGVAYHANGDDVRALPHLTRALAIFEQAFGPTHHNVALAEINLSSALRASGKAAAALPHARRAVEIDLVALGTDHPDMRYALLEVGYVLHVLARDREALGPLERALALITANADADAAARADVRFALAQALRGAGREPARALALADEARRAYAAISSPEATTRGAEIDRWRASTAPLRGSARHER